VRKAREGSGPESGSGGISRKKKCQPANSRVGGGGGQFLAKQGKKTIANPNSVAYGLVKGGGVARGRLRGSSRIGSIDSLNACDMKEKKESLVKKGRAGKNLRSDRMYRSSSGGFGRGEREIGLQEKKKGGGFS